MTYPTAFLDELEKIGAACPRCGQDHGHLRESLNYSRAGLNRLGPRFRRGHLCPECDAVWRTKKRYRRAKAGNLGKYGKDWFDFGTLLNSLKGRKI